VLRIRESDSVYNRHSKGAVRVRLTLTGMADVPKVLRSYLKYEPARAKRAHASEASARERSERMRAKRAQIRCCCRCPVGPGLARANKVLLQMPRRSWARTRKQVAASAPRCDNLCLLARSARALSSLLPRPLRPQKSSASPPPPRGLRARFAPPPLTLFCARSPRTGTSPSGPRTTWASPATARSWRAPWPTRSGATIFRESQCANNWRGPFSC
jgi:hypothetical protein